MRARVHAARELSITRREGAIDATQASALLANAGPTPRRDRLPSRFNPAFETAIVVTPPPPENPDDDARICPAARPSQPRPTLRANARRLLPRRDGLEVDAAEADLQEGSPLQH